MVAINQDELIGSIIPSVYISRITLESSGYPARESNPHIDHSRERVINTDTDGLVATVDLIVKEKLGNDLIGTWFANNDITKYLNLNVYQITDPMLTTYLGYGVDSFGLLRGQYAPGDIRYELASAMLGASRPNEIVTVEKVETWLNLNSTLQMLPLNKEIEGNDSDISQFKSRVDDDGNVVYDITYRLRFESSKSKPEHLSFFAFCKIDIEQLAADFDFDLDQIGESQTTGNVVSDIVIDNSAVSSKTFVYFDSQQKLWPGPVHNVGGSWFSGARASADSIPLTRKTVLNAKIQDFRNEKEIEKLMIDFSKVENDIISANTLKRLSNDTIVSTYKDAYFSDMELTRNADGDAKFLFVVDFKKAIVERSVLGRLLSNKQELCRQAITRTKISSMRVYRQRVKEDFSLTLSGTPSGLSPFDKNEPWELIVKSGEKSWKSFNTVNDSRGSLKEEQVILSALESEEDSSSYGVRFFTGMDKTMSEVTDGVYRYVVEVEIDDNTSDYIRERIDTLLTAKKELEEYLSQGSQQSVSRYVPEIKDPHIESSAEIDRSGAKTAGNYDLASNRFTDYFINKMFEKYGEGSTSSPWNFAPLVYTETLSLFTGMDSSSSNKQKTLMIADTLHNFLNPTTGNPRSVGMVIRLIDKLANNLATIIGSTISSRKYGNISQLSANHSVSKAPKHRFKISKAFNAIFDSEVTKSSGADYLSIGKDTTRNNDGLRRIEAEEYFERVKRETQKYSGEKEPDVNISGVTSDDSYNNTSYTFLTPTILYTNTEELILEPDADEVNPEDFGGG